MCVKFEINTESISSLISVSFCCLKKFFISDIPGENGEYVSVSLHTQNN